MKWRNIVLKSFVERMNKTEKTFVYFYVLWFVFAVAEAIVIIIYNNNDVVVECTKFLPNFSFNVGIIIRWATAYFSIANVLGVQLVLVFSFCVLLWITAGTLTILTLSKLSKDDVNSEFSFIFLALMVLSIILSTILYLLIMSPIMFLIFSAIIFSCGVIRFLQ